MADAIPGRDPRQVLRQEIIGDARRQAERVLRRARQECENIMATARSEAEKESRQMLDRARATAARRVALALARIPVETGRLRAAHVELLLERVRAESRDRLAAAREEPEERSSLLALASEAMRGMEGESFVMRLAPGGRQALGEEWLPALRAQAGKAGIAVTLGEPLARGENGVIVSDATGRQVWDNRVAARLERLWPALRIAVAERLGLLA